ncbi:MBL fold metallo-hydrolase [Ideonella livida]|uniref:MBL fold metallo-hydrolase n=1 Tax=Ideonella livida TaxID=2707176 RepID=A0A7C9PHG3_9BURK|nr:MBL fold metallo-hydrolase [Ideonella livida]NDY91829.1 MBL fold metallo-hydrolase [Ideonella livida]
MAALLGLAALASDGDSAGGVPAHHTGQGFRNLHGEAAVHKGLWPYLKMKWWDSPFPVPGPHAALAVAPLDRGLLQAPAHPLQVTWLGHATALIQSQGMNVLTDPVLGERASPLPFIGPRRYTPAPARLEDLPTLQVVLISHNHYDHLERETVARLGDRVCWLVPLGLGDWFARLGVHRVVELDWWQSTQVGDMRFTLTPTQHWSRRGLLDTDRTLWGGWAMEHHGQRIWFGGDTGYAQPLFQAIGQRLGPFDLALIPIGGYGPRDFMQDKHVDPDQAVRIHRDLGARRSVGIHWGTFVLTAEPLDEPPHLLAEALERQGVAADAFTTEPPGRTLAVPLPPLPPARPTASSASPSDLQPANPMGAPHRADQGCHP